MLLLSEGGSFNRLRFVYGRRIDIMQNTMPKVVGASYGKGRSSCS